MGIDIYARWKGQTQDEHSKQESVWLSTRAGSRGYLREAYHGGPYATRFLCAEAFEKGQAEIPASVLRERLPQTLVLAEERARTLYKASDNQIEKAKQSFRDFVSLCEEKERETGEPVTIVADY